MGESINESAFNLREAIFQLPHKPDDDNLALVFVDVQKGKIAYFHQGWHLYENGVWVPMADQELKQSIRQFLRLCRGKEVRVSNAQVNALFSMLEGDYFMPDRKLIGTAKEQKHYIPLRNGLFNLETMALEPHRPDLYFTTQLEFDYDAEADYPTWGKFLRTSLVLPDGKPDAEMIQLLREALGYSMTARTDLKSSFWLMGKPNSGKSTLIAFIRSLMGNLNVTIDLNQLAGNRFILASVVGKRVVTFTEADSGIALPDALYKAMVGGEDAIYSDVKNKEGISFVPEFKLWWAMNEAPRVLDRSGATINRLKVLLFNRSVPQEQQIIGLVQMLERERSGVFNWAMQGYRQLLQRGKFIDPMQSAHWLANYRLENDTERTYFLERLGPDAETQIASGFLYDDYRAWCENNGFKPKNANQVSKEWERLGLKKVKKNNGNWWQGAKIKDSTKLI